MGKIILKDEKGNILTDKQEKAVHLNQVYNYLDFEYAEIQEPNATEALKDDMNRLIQVADSYDKLIRQKHLENEQFFLDWQDKLNEISVR